MSKEDKAATAVAILCFGYIAGMMLIGKLFQGHQIGFYIWIIYTLLVVLGAVIYDKIEDTREANHRLARELSAAQMQLIRERKELLDEITRLEAELKGERNASTRDEN